MRHATQRGLNSTRCRGRWSGRCPSSVYPAPRYRPNPIDLAGGHKMTDDEIREALRLDFEQTADWRRSKAAEYPEDSRNLEAAALLDKLAASVETVAPALFDAYGSLRDDYMDSEQHSEMFRQIGFHSWPETAEDFVRACIADRATGTQRLGEQI